MHRVSVVVPNYNHERFLERRIQSVLEQTYQDFELILLDDASTDDSLRIIERYRSDPRVTIVVNETNSGSPFPQWNRGVGLARGEYVWIAEADDDAEPELLETLVGALDNRPSVVLASCPSWLIDEHGTRLGTTLSWNDQLDQTRWKSSFLSNGLEEVRRYIVLYNTIQNASAVVFRRSAFVESGGAPETMRLCGDWMTWASLACRGDIAFIAEPLNLFREHSGTVRSSTAEWRRLHEAVEVTAAIERKTGVPEDLREKLSTTILKQWETEYWRQPQTIAFSVVCRVGAFLWRMNHAAGIRFLAFFLSEKTLGRLGPRVARKVSRLFEHFVRM